MSSIDSDVKFPDMKYYNMSKAGDMALYLAHCDFYPFRSVIEMAEEVAHDGAEGLRIDEFAGRDAFSACACCAGGRRF